MDRPVQIELQARGGYFQAVNWEAINAVAQLVSSSRSSRRCGISRCKCIAAPAWPKLAAQDSAASALRDVTKPFSENVEVGRLWRTGLENLDALSADDRARFYHVAFQFLKAMETIHFHYIYGLMDEQIWRGWWNLYRHYLASPGLEYYWSLRHDLFSERFRTFVDSLDRPAERMTVGNLLGQETSPAAPR
ncbi:MAG: hypothetical protein ACR2FX_05550 [Chthoniobacterales bacterium]